jgi:hypothetical protein
MSETAGRYGYLHYRAAILDQIARALGDGTLGELPDVFLILIERALHRDLSGIAEIARRHLRQSNSGNHQ